MTKYARDEFDRVPETSTRQGVHRAVAESRRRRHLGPILAVGAASLAVGLVAFLILPNLGLSSPGTTLAVTAEQGGSSAAASPAPTASSPVSASPAASGTPSAAATPSATPSAATPSAAPATAAAAATVDKSQPVAVYNATTTAGLANRVGGTITTAGWTVGTLGNWGGVAQQRSVIFYSGATQKSNAEALGKLLGIPAAVDSAEFQLPLVVVLAPGFR